MRALLLAALTLSGVARAWDTVAVDGADVVVDVLTTRDGLPLNHQMGVALDRGGFLWLATADGLARFDGQAFRTWRGSEHPELSTVRLHAVEVDEQGRVWVVTAGAELARLDGERFTVWRSGAHEDRFFDLDRVGGRVWVHGGPSGLTLAAAEGPRRVVAPLRLLGETLAEVHGEVLVGDVGGGLWALSPEGEARLRVASVGVGPVRQVLEDPRGGAWVAGDAGLAHVDGDRVRPVADSRGPVCSMAFTDRLHVLDAEGLRVLVGDRLRTVEPPDPRGCVVRLAAWDGALLRIDAEGLTLPGGGRVPLSHVASDLLRAPDGSLWVATMGAGLLHLRRPLAPAVFAGPPSALYTVAVDAEGAVWGRTNVGETVRVDAEGRRLELPLPEVLGQRSARPGMLTDREGRVWFAAVDRVCRLEGGACDDVLPEVKQHDVGAMLHARDGRVWVADASRLLVGTPGGSGWRWTDLMSGAGLLPRSDVLTLAEGEDGVIWVSLAGGGVARLGPAGVRRLTRAEGLSSDHVRALLPTPGGGVWAGTEGAGLCLISPDASRARCLGQRQGLFAESVHTLSRDRFGALWMSTNQGIVRVLEQALLDVLAGRAAGVSSLGLTERDGMRSREANGGTSPAVAEDARGRLWFPTMGGLVRVDPAAVASLPPPRAMLDEVLAGGAPVALPASGALSLSADQAELRVRWTAAELIRPDQVRFRFRLTGQDEGWRGPTADREFTWARVSPGEHELHVQAALGGAWGPPVVVRLRREPAFVETAGFPLSLVAVGLALGLVAFRGTQRGARRRQERLETLVASRTADLARSNRSLVDQAALLEQQAATLEDQGRRLAEQAATLRARNDALTAASAHLAEVDALRRRLVADLSHELRTPLTLVLGPLDDLARTGVVPPGPARDRLEVVLRNARRLETLVDQLLDVARLESGRILLRVRRRDLGAFVKRVVGRFEHELVREGLSVSLRLPEAPVLAYVDPDLLDKVLSNLLGNAMKFTPSGGAVEVALEVDAPGELATVAVRDTGIGVSEDLRTRLFDRFVQGDHGDARRFEGVGIGLSLARDLVALHGGEIGVAPAEGGGSRFWFTLPLGVDHLALEDVNPEVEAEPDGPGLLVRPASLPVADPPDGDRPRVLVVEDHPDMRDFLVDHLRRRFRVEAVGGGAAALERARAAPPDVIVSDVMMPEMDGLALCRALRADPALAGIPVLLASAKASEEDRVAGLEVADDYMSKPLRMRELLLRVGRLATRAATPPAEAPDAPAGSLVDQQLRERVEATIAERMGEPDFGVEQLAKALAYSRRQLLREVQRVCGESPSDLLRLRRMEEGRRLVTTGAVGTVSEAADRVGLSLAYFSRTWSAWYGHPPSEVLKALREPIQGEERAG